MTAALALIVGLLAIPFADLDTRRWLARWWNKPRPVAPPHRGGGYRPRAVVNPRTITPPPGPSAVRRKPQACCSGGAVVRAPGSPCIGCKQRPSRPAPNPTKPYVRRM